MKRESLDYTNKRKWIYTRDGFKCLRCGRNRDLTIDHILPISRGGDWSIDNLQTLCRKCNNWKDSKIISYIGKVADPSLIIPYSYKETKNITPNQINFKIVGKINI